MFALRSDLRNYLIALAAVTTAVVLRFAIDPVLDENLPYYVFYFAVLAAALVGGLGPGLAALITAFVCATYFFAYPRYSLEIFDKEDLLGAFRFASLGLLLTMLGHWGRERRRAWQLRMDAKESDLTRARQEKESTQHLLASIGDGLITVDVHGKVTFMNQVAEQLSGWKQDEAKGLPMEQVFPLVDEFTRTPVANPALRALELGTTAVLPENVALIARDGTERAIDDSGSPIRDAHGTLIGSVLIFRDITERRKRSRVAAATDFTVAGLSLHPMDDRTFRIVRQEREDLELACRIWIEREWSLNEQAVRMVALRGFNLIIRQERTEVQPDGGTAVYFSVVYERLSA